MPDAIWVTLPKGIIIPHMLSHTAGHRSAGIAALDPGSQFFCFLVSEGTQSPMAMNPTLVMCC